MMPPMSAADANERGRLGTLVGFLLCKILLWMKMDNSETKSKASNSMDINTQEQMKPHSLIRGTSDYLMHHLNELRKRELFIDVVLKGHDGTRISAHRNILAAASPYFMAMFSGDFPESRQPEICLPEMDTECLQLVVEFIYTGLVDISDDCVHQLMQTASFLQLDHLSDMCGKHMGDLLDAENCVCFKRFAEIQNNKILLDMSDDYIISNFREVMQTDEAYKMSYEEIISILSNNELLTYSDDTTLKGIVRWAEFKSDTRLGHLSQLLRFIHPMYVSSDATRNLTSLQKQSDCSQWLSKVKHYEGCQEWRIFLTNQVGKNSEMCRYDLKTGGKLTLKAPPKPDVDYSLAAHKNILYKQGGGVLCSTTNSYYYNIYRDQWHDLTPLQKKRSQHCSLILNDCLYAIGGYTQLDITNSVEYLNLATCKSYFSKPMRAHRSSMGGVVHENCMYVMGGGNGKCSYRCLERYDPRENTWKFLAPMNSVKGNCSSAVLGDYIYCHERMKKWMERYNIRANKWEVLNFEEYCECYEIFNVDNQLYSICSRSVIAHYDFEANKWNAIQSFPHDLFFGRAMGMKMVNYDILED